MKASELIKAVTEIMQDKGDLPILISTKLYPGATEQGYTVSEPDVILTEDTGADTPADEFIVIRDWPY